MGILRTGRKQSLKKKNGKGVVKLNRPSLFGMYYKDNTEEGFNLVVDDFSKENEPLIDDLMKMFRLVQECFEKEMVRISRKDTGIEYLTKSVKYNLELGIENWNTIQGISSREKGLVYGLTIDFGDRFFTETLFHIMYGIYFLVQVGDIIDDNYNGFHFMNQYERVS